MKSRIFKDRIIAYKKTDKFLAVSLEFDLLAEGKDMIQALKRLHDATTGYLKTCYEDNETDKEIYRKAPKKYQDMYDLFMELSEKTHKKEKSFKEVSSIQLTYTSESFCHA